jgi:hypothetical protein
MRCVVRVAFACSRRHSLRLMLSRWRCGPRRSVASVRRSVARRRGIGSVDACARCVPRPIAMLSPRRREAIIGSAGTSRSLARRPASRRKVVRITERVRVDGTARSVRRPTLRGPMLRSPVWTTLPRSEEWIAWILPLRTLRRMARRLTVQVIALAERRSTPRTVLLRSARWISVSGTAISALWLAVGCILPRATSRLRRSVLLVAMLPCPP